MKNYHSRHLHVGGGYVDNPDYIPGCKPTYLIQRLKKPVVGDDGRWSFGGGLLRGGFSEEFWPSVSALCHFDKMGASQFERGEVPRALEVMDSARPLEAWPMTVLGSPEFLRSDMIRACDSKVLSELREQHVLEATVFVLAPRKLRQHVKDLILSLAVGDDDFVRERTCLRDTLFFSPEWADCAPGEWSNKMSQGWVEIDNGFMFFSNEEMWRGFCELFGVEPSGTDITPVRPDFSEINKTLELCLSFEQVTP